MSNEQDPEWVTCHPYDRRPGVVLGPYEALLAMLLWLPECLREIERGSWKDGIVELPGRVNPRIRRRILTAFLLFGHLDAVAGMRLLDSYLSLHGIPQSRREIFGDFVSWEREKTCTPFAHPLEEGCLSHPIDFADMQSIQSIAGVTATPVVRALRRAGYPVYASIKRRIEEELRLGLLHVDAAGKSWLRVLAGPVSQVPFALLAAIERSIELQSPFFSVDAAGPAWVSPWPSEPHIQVFRIIWEEVNWLPNPQSFVEALSMAEDDRIHGFRDDVDLWVHCLSVGALADLEDVRSSVLRRVAAFREKPWATRVGRLVTYAAAPVAATEVISGSYGLGLGVAAVGSALQWISDRMEATKKSSWLSLGRDML